MNIEHFERQLLKNLSSNIPVPVSEQQRNYLSSVIRKQVYDPNENKPLIIKLVEQPQRICRYKWALLFRDKSLAIDAEQDFLSERGNAIWRLTKLIRIENILIIQHRNGGQLHVKGIYQKLTKNGVVPLYIFFINEDISRLHVSIQKLHSMKIDDIYFHITWIYPPPHFVKQDPSITNDLTVVPSINNHEKEVHQQSWKQKLEQFPTYKRKKHIDRPLKKDDSFIAESENSSSYFSQNNPIRQKILRKMRRVNRKIRRLEKALKLKPLVD